MYDPLTLSKEQERTLDISQKLDIVNQLESFGNKYGFTFNHFCLMGGDPLLADDVFDFVRELKKRGKIISFGGNPETLTEENCKKLKKFGIRSFQLSLDGLENTHDSIRGKGSFRRTILGYQQLDKYKINTKTMITLSYLNVHDFFDLIDYVFYNTESKGIAFDFCSNVGNAKEFETQITPELALEISIRYLELKEARKKERSDFHFSEKPGFIRLLRWQRKEIVFYENVKTNFFAGCLIGCRSLCILSDGTILSCRRYPEILGRMPEDSIEYIFLSNETLKKHRRPQYFDECGKCIGWNWCRGCPAVAYGETENPFRKPSACFAHLLDVDTYIEHTSVPLQTTLKEEADLIKNTTVHQHYELLHGLKISYRILMTLWKLKNHAETKYFIENPKTWFCKNAPTLNHDEQNIVVHHFNMKKL